MACRQSLKARPYLAALARSRPHEDARDPARHAGQLLRVGQRRDRDRAVHERADVRALQRGGKESRHDTRADLELDLLQ